MNIQPVIITVCDNNRLDVHEPAYHKSKLLDTQHLFEIRIEHCRVTCEVINSVPYPVHSGIVRRSL